MTQASFPSLGMRRGRSSPWMRGMLAEHRLHPSDLIWPLFICEGQGCEEPVASLPGVSRWSVDKLADRALLQDFQRTLLLVDPNAHQPSNLVWS